MLIWQQIRFKDWIKQYSNLLSDAVENFVHFHACWVPVVTEADHEDSVLLRQDGLVDLPAIVEMR